MVMGIRDIDVDQNIPSFPLPYLYYIWSILWDVPICDDTPIPVYAMVIDIQHFYLLLLILLLHCIEVM